MHLLEQPFKYKTCFVKQEGSTSSITVQQHLTTECVSLVNSTLKIHQWNLHLFRFTDYFLAAPVQLTSGTLLNIDWVLWKKQS